MKHDDIANPEHYTWIPGIECKDVASHFHYCEGNAIKYIWRSGKKQYLDMGVRESRLKDLRKAVESLNNAIKFWEKEGYDNAGTV